MKIFTRSHTRTIFPLFALLSGMTAQAQTWQLTSPNGRVQIEVERSGEGLPRYSVRYDNNLVIASSRLGIQTHFSSRTVTEAFTTPEVTRRSVDEVYHVVLGKTRTAPDRYNEMTLRFIATNNAPDIDLIFRAYDEGAAFRHVVSAQPDVTEYTIFGERTEFLFPADYACWGANMGRFYTAHESEFDPVMASNIRNSNNYDSPLVCKTGHAETAFALAEADVENYPGAYYTRPWNNALGVVVRLAPAMEAIPSDRYAVKITQPGTPLRTPWRVIMLGDSPRALVEFIFGPDLGRALADCRYQLDPRRKGGLGMVEQLECARCKSRTQYRDLSCVY